MVRTPGTSCAWISLFKEVGANDEERHLAAGLEEYARLLGTNGPYDGAASSPRAACGGFNYKGGGPGAFAAQVPGLRVRVATRACPGRRPRTFPRARGLGRGHHELLCGPRRPVGFNVIVLWAWTFRPALFWLEHDIPRRRPHARRPARPPQHGRRRDRPFRDWRTCWPGAGCVFAVYNPRSCWRGALRCMRGPAPGCRGRGEA
jgi:hypothetical protein